jgi:hypothetical protein
MSSTGPPGGAYEQPCSQHEYGFLSAGKFRTEQPKNWLAQHEQVDDSGKRGPEGPVDGIPHGALQVVALAARLMRGKPSRIGRADGKRANPTRLMVLSAAK